MRTILEDKYIPGESDNIDLDSPVICGRDTLHEMRELGRQSDSKRFEDLRRVLGNPTDPDERLDSHRTRERMSYATAKQQRENEFEVKKQVETRLESAQRRPSVAAQIRNDVQKNYENIRNDNDKIVNTGLEDQEEKLKRRINQRLNKSFNKSMTTGDNLKIFFVLDQKS